MHRSIGFDGHALRCPSSYGLRGRDWALLRLGGGVYIPRRGTQGSVVIGQSAFVSSVCD